MCSKRMSPRLTTSALLSGRSTTWLTRLMVSMPSCTTPMFSKMPATTHRIHPDMATMRMVRPVTTAMAPMLTASWLHSQIASPLALTISRPLSEYSTKSMVVTRRSDACHLPNWSSSAARA